ncbi:hypothetical protein R3P38DRAFT_2786180 [Favolaschia claudopus]|uniref:Uncharacterized protein n=1 Tax=Favolaschia claudopus TaxID=2862362 RepID=A0AAW0AS64_9AGAR
MHGNFALQNDIYSRKVKLNRGNFAQPRWSVHQPVMETATISDPQAPKDIEKSAGGPSNDHWHSQNEDDSDKMPQNAASLKNLRLSVLLGNFVPQTGPALDRGRFVGVSVPIAVGLLVMMYPILCNVRYEPLNGSFQSTGTIETVARIQHLRKLDRCTAPHACFGVGFLTRQKRPTDWSHSRRAGKMHCDGRLVSTWKFKFEFTEMIQGPHLERPCRRPQ